MFNTFIQLEYLINLVFLLKFSYTNQPPLFIIFHLNLSTSGEVGESFEITSYSRDSFRFPTNISLFFIFFRFIETHVLVCHHHYFRVVLQRYAELSLKISFLTNTGVRSSFRLPNKPEILSKIHKIKTNIEVILSTRTH